MARGGIPSFKNASTASWAVRDLNRAFNELATTGEVTYKTLSAMVGLITRMSPVLGLVAEAAFLTYESFQLLKKQDLADAFTQFTIGAHELNLEFDIQASKMAAVAGKYPELHGALSKLADINARLRGEEKGWSEEVTRHSELVKKGTETEAQATGELENSSRVRLQHIQHLEDERGSIERLMPGMKHYAEALHTIAGELTIIQAEARAGDNTVGASFFTNDLLNLNKLIAQGDYYIQQQKQGMRDKAAAQQYEGVAGEKLLATDKGILESTIANTNALKDQVRILAQVGQMADSAISGTATSAFDAYAGAMDHVISLNNLFSDSTGRAFRNAESQVVKSLGQMATVHMLEELALAATTSLNPAAQALYGPPSVHLQAAAMWGAVAVAAGLGAAALSVNPGGGVGGGGGGGPHGPAGGGDNLYVNVTVIGALDDRQLEDLNNQLQTAQMNRRLI